MTPPTNIEITRWCLWAKPDPGRQALGEVWYESDGDPGRAFIHIMETQEGAWAYASSKREPDPAARLPWSDDILDDLREFFLAGNGPWPALVLRRIKVDGLPDLLEAVCSLCGELHRFIDYPREDYDEAVCRSPLLNCDHEARMPFVIPLPGMDRLHEWERGEMEIKLTLNNPAGLNMNDLAAKMFEINRARFGVPSPQDPKETP